MIFNGMWMINSKLFATLSRLNISSPQLTVLMYKIQNETVNQTECDGNQIEPNRDNRFTERFACYTETGFWDKHAHQVHHYRICAWGCAEKLLWGSTPSNAQEFVKILCLCYHFIYRLTPIKLILCLLASTVQNLDFLWVCQIENYVA